MNYAIAGLFLAFTLPAAAAGVQWQTLSSGAASVEFPGTPSKKVYSEPAVTNYTLALSPTVMLVFSDSQYGELQIDAAKALKMALDGGPCGNVLGTTKTDDTVDGRAGGRAECTPEGGARVVERAFFFNNHLYQLVVSAGNATAAQTAAAKRFHDSLRFH